VGFVKEAGVHGILGGRPHVHRSLCHVVGVAEGRVIPPGRKQAGKKVQGGVTYFVLRLREERYRSKKKGFKLRHEAGLEAG
jgi:hypothetical protein